MSRLYILLLLLQLAIVLSQGRYQGRRSRTGTGARRSWSSRRQGRNQDEESPMINTLPDPQLNIAMEESYPMADVIEGSGDEDSEAATETPEPVLEEDDSDLVTSMSTDAPSQESEEPSQSSGVSPISPKTKKYLNWYERCGSCEGEAEDPVCGSDGHTYSNMCSLEYTACRKYWDIVLEYKVST